VRVNQSSSLSLRDYGDLVKGVLTRVKVESSGIFRDDVVVRFDSFPGQTLT